MGGWWWGEGMGRCLGWSRTRVAPEARVGRVRQVRVGTCGRRVLGARGRRVVGAVWSRAAGG